MKKLTNIFICAVLLLFGSCSGNSDDLPEVEEKNGITVMTYNIHYGNGIDGVLNLGRIADVIKNADPDILVLNEIDRNYDPRSNYQDQLQVLADRLDMNYKFQKTTWKAAIPESSNKPREFGQAVMSKHPIELIDNIIYEKYKTHYYGLLKTRISINGNILYIYATQLDATPECLSSQSEELLRNMLEQEGLMILCGDLNATPENPAISNLSDIYTDAFVKQNMAYTFKSDNPKQRIDYIFGSKGITFKNSRVIQSQASDHLPIITEVYIE